MGTFTHPITLHSKAGETSETVHAIVDKSRLFALFSRSLLERLGAQPEESRDVPIGQIEAELNGERATIVCAFGDDGEPARIGRHTLDTFLLDVDPETGELVPKTFRIIQHI